MISRGLVLTLLTAGGCAVVKISGLLPVSPSPNSGRVGSLTPTLRWEAFEGDPSGWMTDIRYDLRVMRPDGTAVYSKDGLAGPEHTLETPLEPETSYLWTVRARFCWQGHPRQTQWSALTNPLERMSLLLSPRDIHYLPLSTPANPAR